jgi:hypothetical protein
MARTDTEKGHHKVDIRRILECPNDKPEQKGHVKDREYYGRGERLDSKETSVVDVYCSSHWMLAGGFERGKACGRGEVRQET